MLNPSTLRLSLQIIFFEGRNFQGSSYDCSEIIPHLSRRSSCRVEIGTFVVYDRPDFTGRQCVLTAGESPPSIRAPSASVTASSPAASSLR